MFASGFFKIDGKDDRLFQRSPGCHDPVIPHQDKKLIPHDLSQFGSLLLRSNQIFRFVEGNFLSKMHSILSDDLQSAVKQRGEHDRIKRVNVDHGKDIFSFPIHPQVDGEFSMESPFSFNKIPLQIRT